MEFSNKKQLHWTIIRHGESEYNKKNLFTGWYNCSLSENGIKEAQEGAEFIKNKGIDYDIAYTSFLARATETYQIIKDKLKEKSGKKSSKITSSPRTTGRKSAAIMANQ